MKKTIIKTAMYEKYERPLSECTPRFTDPVKYAEAQADHLLKFYCKQGLLKPIPPSWRPKRGRYDHRLFCGHSYSVQRHPLKDNDQFILEQLHDLSRDLRRFAECYRASEHEEAAFRAIRIGRLLEQLEVCQYDADVKYGRPGLQQLTKNREKAIAKRREEFAPVHQEIIKKLKASRSWQGIINDFAAGKHNLPADEHNRPADEHGKVKIKVSRSTVARLARRYRKSIRKK